MIEDLKLRSVKIPTTIRGKVFDILINNSGLLQRREVIRKSVKKILINIYKENIYPKELLDLFSKSKRIADKLRYIRVNYRKLFRSIDNYYPNNILMTPETNGIRIFMDGSFQLDLKNELEILPGNSKICYEDFNNFIDRVNPDKIKLLKYISIDMFENLYDIENFKGGRQNFLSDINTFGELYNYNKDFYEIAYEIFIKEFVNDKKDISSLLKNLKTILES